MCVPIAIKYACGHLGSRIQLCESPSKKCRKSMKTENSKENCKKTDCTGHYNSEETNPGRFNINRVDSQDAAKAPKDKNFFTPEKRRTPSFNLNKKKEKGKETTLKIEYK